MPHIGKDHEEYKNFQLFKEGWSVKIQENYDTWRKEFDDILRSSMNDIFHINDEYYIGQIISCDSINIKIER